MVCGLGDRSLDKVKIRLLLSDLELPHCGVDLVLGKAKLLAEDREVQQAHQHEQQRPPETKHADQRLDSHSRRLTRQSRMTRKKIRICSVSSAGNGTDLLGIDASLDHGLYARRHVGKEIEARNRLDLIHAHTICSPVTVNRSRVGYDYGDRVRRRSHS